MTNVYEFYYEAHSYDAGVMLVAANTKEDAIERYATDTWCFDCERPDLTYNNVVPEGSAIQILQSCYCE